VAYIFAILALITILPAAVAGTVEKSAADVSAPVVDSAKPGVYKFDIEGVGTASKYERKIDAQLRAEQDALASAMRQSGYTEGFVGISDFMGESDKGRTQSIQQYLLTFMKGAAVWDLAGEPQFSETADGGTQCRAHIKGEIALNGKPDPSFEILPAAGSGKIGMSQLVYEAGQNVSVTLRVSTDSYVYIICVDEKQNAYMVFPNATSKDNLVKSGANFDFPPVNGGYLLKAVLPEGEVSSMEALHLIAVKKPIWQVPTAKLNTANGYESLSAGTLSDIMKKLAALDRSEWTMAVIPYEIRR